MPHFFINSNTIDEDERLCDPETSSGRLEVRGKGRKLIISDENNYKHIAKSLRAKVGETLLLIDENQIQYEVKIEKITSGSVETIITKSYKSKRKLDFNLFLAQSPLRSDAQSLIIEKATELGVMGIYPIFTDNCVLNKQIIEKKIPKWQKTMIEASKQCERADIPTCYELTNMQKLIVEGNFQRILAFTERSAKYDMKTYLRDNPILKGENILVIIGPEGGFSSKEFEYFEQKSITTLSLGDLILKAETAVITALGNIIYEYN